MIGMSGIDEAPPGYVDLPMRDVLTLETALRAAADYMYSDINEKRVDSVPERLFVHVGTIAVYLGASRIISEETTLAILAVLDAKHHQLRKEYPSIEERNKAYYVALKLKLRKSEVEGTPQTPYKKQASPTSPIVPRIGAQMRPNCVLRRAGVPTGAVGSNGRGIKKRGNLVGAARRHKMKSIAQIRRNRRESAQLDAEISTHFNDLLYDSAVDKTPGVLITIGHCAAISAGCHPVGAGVVAAVAHIADMYRRNLYKSDDDALHAVTTAGGARTATTGGIVLTGQVLLSRSRRLAAQVSAETWELMVRARDFFTRGAGTVTVTRPTPGMAADSVAYLAEYEAVRVPIEFVADNSAIIGGVTAGIGVAVLGYNYTQREVKYEKLRLERWLKLNDDKDAKKWRDSILGSMRSIKQNQKRNRKEGIENELRGALSRRLDDDDQDEESEIRTIETFIDEMRVVEAKVRDLLNPLHPDIANALYVAGDQQEYDGSGFIQPRPPPRVAPPPPPAGAAGRGAAPGRAAARGRGRGRGRGGRGVGAALVVD